MSPGLASRESGQQMNFKLFTFLGNIHIAKMDNEVNEWLATLGPRVEIKHTNTASDRGSNNNTGGEDRRITLMVWTGPKRNKEPPAPPPRAIAPAPGAGGRAPPPSQGDT